VKNAVLHTPVLVREVMEGLEVKPGGRYIDSTVGTAGHAKVILDLSSPDGTLLGIDQDPQAVEVAQAMLQAYGSRVALVHDSFSRLAAIASEKDFVPADGVLLDLGVSSLQLEQSERGFSFQAEGPLDMRMDPHSRVSAELLVNTLTEQELAEVIARYGEEPKARAVARAIVRHRPIGTTTQLAEIVAQAIRRRSRLHPATRTFQALRIAVNDELDALSAVLPQAIDVLRKGGRLAVISFHSLEDRLVKQFMARESTDCICPPGMPGCRCGHQRTLVRLTRKPIRPSPAESSENPRSRSAKLRIAMKV